MVTLDDCYTQSNIVVKANGTTLTATSGVYTIVNITANQNVTIEGVQINTYTITATVNNPVYGTIIPEGTTSVECGEFVDYAIFPNENYKISDVLVNGESQGALTTYIFENVQSDGSIYAIFIEEVSITENPLSNITLYPNPTTGELQVTSYELQVTGIEVFDIYGRNHTPHTSYLTPHTSLDISHLSAGVYFVKIYTDKGMVVSKVVKE